MYRKALISFELSRLIQSIFRPNSPNTYSVCWPAMVSSPDSVIDSIVPMCILPAILVYLVDFNIDDKYIDLNVTVWAYIDLLATLTW